MEILFMVFVAIGFFAVLCSIAAMIGRIICALLKYVVLPLGILFFLCCLLRGGA